MLHKEISLASLKRNGAISINHIVQRIIITMVKINAQMLDFRIVWDYQKNPHVAVTRLNIQRYHYAKERVLYTVRTNGEQRTIGPMNVSEGQNVLVVSMALNA